jgi:hypothetical protein
VPTFSVRCAEVVPCPCCGGSLSMIGSLYRKLSQSRGEQRLLVIRRLRCQNCRKIHHELPDCVVPYKRYESACVENGVSSEPAEIVVAADHSTLCRWRSWFRSQTTHLLGCLASIAIRFGLDVAEGSSYLRKLHTIVSDVSSVMPPDGWPEKAPITRWQLVPI